MKKDVEALVYAAKEAREACAAFMRVIVLHELTNEALKEAWSAGVTNGFGLRLQDAIQRVEKAIKEEADEHEQY